MPLAATHYLFSKKFSKGGRGMKLSQPRITPLTEAEWTDEQRKALEPVHKEGRVYNVLGTLARHWEAAKKFEVWGYHVMGKTSTLPPREREIAMRPGQL